jgi:DNA-binding SARP family transcriptional activator/tetratricopeptide (TPR) repeat protein
MIRLRTLGECVMEIDGTPYGPECDALFAGLVYLTTERGRKVSRVELAELLWPRLPPERGRHNLRQLLYRMKMVGVTVDGARDTLVLPEHQVVPTFSAAPAPERLVAERIAGTLRIGSFLPGYWPTFSDPFADWVERARGTVEARVRRVVLEVARAHKLRGEWEEVDALACDCLRLDPLNEEGTLARAEAAAMLGEKQQAVAILDRFLEEVGHGRAELRLPATVLRRRISERFPTRRYAGPSDRCFVGRAALMQTLSTALLRARNGEGSAVLLTGAPGIGKTRLVQELSRVGVMQGVRVVRVGVDEADVHRPLSAFAGAVPQLRALPGAIGVSPEGLAFLDRLTESVPPPGTAPEETRDPRWLAGRIRQSVVDLCDAVTTEGTLLLAIEDVHWLDASSWATIDALIDWSPAKRVLLVLTSRGPHPTPLTPRRCVERLDVYPVAALTPDAADAFVRAIAADHGGPLGDEARAWCVEVGEGNPLFLRELVIHCLEGGRPHAVPPSLQGLLDARIARLTPTGRRVLDAAAVLGDLTTVERLAQMLELQAHQLAGALAELSEALLLDEASATVALRHELVAARVTAAMAGPVRRLLHRRAATVLDDVSSDDSTFERTLAAAAHWKASGDEKRTASTLSNAADLVSRLGATPEAISFLERALALDPAEPLRASIVRRLAVRLALDGRWRRAGELFNQLGEEAHPNIDKNAIVDDVLNGLHASFLDASADPRDVMERLHDIAADTELSGTHRLAAARRGIAIAALGCAFDYIDRVWRAVQEPLARCADTDAEYLELVVVYESTAGRMQIALEAAERLEALAAHTTEMLPRLSLLGTVAEAYRAAGLWDRAIHANRTLRAEAQRVSSAHYEVRSLQKIANILIESGRPSEATDLMEEAKTVLGSRTILWYREHLLADHVRLALARCAYDEARTLASRFEASCAEFKHQTLWLIRDLATLKAEVALMASPEPLPVELVGELEWIHETARGMLLQDRAVAVLALALERAGRASDAAAILNEYLPTRRQLGKWIAPAVQIGLPPERQGA